MNGVNKPDVRNVLQLIRLGHAEQAKGHLLAFLHTYWERDEYDEVAREVKTFIHWLDRECPGIP